jgi:hypothetical protein
MSKPRIPSDIYIIVDVEFGGWNPLKHPLIAIGMCVVADSKIQPLDYTVSFPFDIEDFEPNTREFWEKHLPVLQNLKENATTRSKEQVVSDIIAFFNRVIDQFPLKPGSGDSNRKIILASDDVCDFLWLDTLFCTYGEKPSRFYTSRNGSFGSQRVLELEDSAAYPHKFFHDHDPLNDAKNLAEILILSSSS